MPITWVMGQELGFSAGEHEGNGVSSETMRDIE